jgi:hypothetical protein
MSVSVGINENVLLSGAEVKTDNNKTSLQLSFVEKGNVAKELDAFDQLAGDGVVDTGSGGGTVIRMWPPLPPLAETKEGTKKSQADLVKETLDALGERKNSLHQILSCFTTTDQIKFNMFAGMDSITRENREQMIITEPVIKQCFINLANQFVAQVTPFLGKDDCAVRLLLVRQSKEKHYAQFRERFVRDNPFIELALIPKEQSKLKFTKYELDKGLNDGTPIAQAAADTLTEVAPESVTNIFGEPNQAEV